MRRTTVMIFLLCAFTGTVLTLQTAQSQDKTSEVRVGIYNSRLVGLAYGRSEAHGKYVESVKAEHKQAKADNDTTKMQELETTMELAQKLMHWQVFGNFPIRDIMEKIADKLPGIAEKAGVDIIVSKWDISFQKSDVEFVDVTEHIVALFNPDEKTQMIMKQMESQPVVPWEDLQDHKH